jgi:L-threonylcarbamoyladenylate synthase
MSQARILPYDNAAIAEAALLVAAGRPVAMPTETVYGLAADATRGDAVAAIYTAKGRPSFNPLIVHVLDLAAADAIADLPAMARKLAEAFWPGPLTLVAPLKPGALIAALATAGLPTIALRAPAHPAMRALLQASGKPLAAPSANASGTISPTRAEHVARSLGTTIDLIVDAGPTTVGLESTIVTVTDDGLRLLRPGPITADQLVEITGLPVRVNMSNTITAPGQLAQHYAPSKPVRLDATETHPDEWLIGFGAVAGDASLSPSGDTTEAAARLFDLLHQADAASAPRIAIAPVPETGLGVAINDRLRRAAA